MKLLPLDWCFSEPFDFESKQYQLLNYLLIVDNSFAKKILSPHFLHIERIIFNMEDYINKLNQFKFSIEKNNYIFFKDCNPNLNNDNLDLIMEIIEFSKPQLKTRLDLGNIILKNNNNQLLF